MASRYGKVYPSDISVEQFEHIRPLLESVRRKTKPAQEDLRDFFNAVLYVLKEGCRWRSLPHDYPCWSNVYYHYKLWRDHVDQESGRPLLELVLKKIDFRGAAQGRARGGDQFAHPRLPEREEHRPG